MKKNFLVTTSLIDSWETDENNFILGRWCEFHEKDDNEKSKHYIKNVEKINIIKNTDHWEDIAKRINDREYVEKKTEDLLEIVSKNLSEVHDVKENKEYWRIIVYNWLASYTTTIFYKWESIRVFFEKNSDKDFYSNFLPFKEQDYLTLDHNKFNEITQKDEWNHLIFLRMFNYLNIKKLKLIKKENREYDQIKNTVTVKQSLIMSHKIINLIDRVLSKIAFSFNKIIFENFSFPKYEYLKICMRCKLIPSKYTNFFDFDVKENKISENNKRSRFRDLLSKIDNQDKFIQFLLRSLHIDMPKSYLENFNSIKEIILPMAKKKKTIFSMYSLYLNDNFKIYIAETKKVGSKYIHAEHGGGFNSPHPFFNYFEKVSDKIITWNCEDKKNIFTQLSPTLPIVKMKNNTPGEHCSIIFCEYFKHLRKFYHGPGLDQLINFFNEISSFVNELNPEIKSKIKFRVKNSSTLNLEKKFSEMFGERHIDKISPKNSFIKTILNSKLIISTYGQTAFSEAMFSNIPTILIIKKNDWMLTEKSWNIFNILKENKMAFEDFNEAKIHIHKYWKEIDKWWKLKNVQSARKEYLANYFNVKSDWYKEWSDYVYLSTSS